MSKFQVTFADNEPIVAGITDEDWFFITIQNGFSVDLDQKPRIVVSTHGGVDGERVFKRTWLNEEISTTTPISIKLVENKEIDEPSEVEEQPWPESMCSFCQKPASQVECVIESPNKFSYICNECVDVCVSEIEKRRAEKAKD